MSAATEERAASDEGPGGWTFWTGLVVGSGLVAFGVRGVLIDDAATNPPALLRWVLGAILIHDLVIASCASAVALVLVRKAATWWGRPVGFAAAMSAVIIVFSIPLVRGFGRRKGNPSALPHDYGTNLAWVLVTLWAAAFTVIGVRAVARRRAR